MSDTPWQFRALLEWPDALHVDLLDGWKWDESNTQVVNSTGIAADPKREFVDRGGALITPWYDSPNTLAGRLSEAWKIHQPHPNYRSQFMLVVQIPGLNENKWALHYLSHWSQYLKWHLDEIGDARGLLANVQEKDLPAARIMSERIRRKRTALATEAQFQARLEATSIEAWGRVPTGDLPEAVTIASAADNPPLVKFRCFAAPIKVEQAMFCIVFATQWLTQVLNNENPADFVVAAKSQLPRQVPFVGWMEKGWSMTNFAHNKRAEVRARLLYLKGTDAR